jgi:hypothetical protein
VTLRRQTGKEGGRAADRFDAGHVLDLGQRDARRFRHRVDAGQGETADGLFGALAVDGRQEGGHIEAMAGGPVAPDPFGGLDRGQDGAVHVEQEGAESTVGQFRLGILRHAGQSSFLELILRT